MKTCDMHNPPERCTSPERRTFVMAGAIRLTVCHGGFKKLSRDSALLNPPKWADLEIVTEEK